MKSLQALLRLGRVAFALASAGLVLLAAPPRAAAEPPMWVIEDSDSTIYLFGTIHVLPRGTVWRTPKIDAAIAEADELWLELPDLSSIGAQIASGVLLVFHGLSPARPLSSRLTPEQFADLDRAARRAGFSARELNIMRPWLAAMVLELQTTIDAGVDATSGVDMELERTFRKRSAPVRGFETIAEQVKVFSTLPEQDEVAYLLETMKSVDVAGDSFNKLVSSWASGDLAVLDKAIVSDMKEGSPALYDALLLRRNANWAGQIEEILKGSGVTFIAVGAGHLVGPDSVQAQLKARGIESTRR